MFNVRKNNFKSILKSLLVYREKYKPGIQIFISLIIGYIAFVLVTDLAILNPTNVNWLMESDPATHYLGWEYFRTAPFLQWPFGANPLYGLEISSSVVYTDSIPLFAFIFKPISQLLPIVFQYFGFWILTCFLLQSFFAYKLLTLFTRDFWLPLLGCAFFAISPFFLWRLSCHYALFAQWLLLAALYLYFNKKHSATYWVGLLILCALIHAYFLVMVLAIWLADFGQRYLLREIKLTKIIFEFFIGISATIFIMCFSGYFMFDSNLQTGGFGYYRMNLLSWIDPDDGWSILLRDQKSGGGDYEGFSYLGIGILVLAFFAFFKLYYRKKFHFSARIIPIFALCILFFLYSLSNKIALGSHEIFTFYLPSFLNIVTGIFRSSGRFIWPVSYIIYVAIFYIIFTRMNRNKAVALCSILLIIQIIDTSIILSRFGEKFGNKNTFEDPLKTKDWDRIALNYKKLIFVLPENHSKNWMILSEFAVTHKMSINTGFFARIDRNKLYLARIKLIRSIIRKELDPEALYFFDDHVLWDVATFSIKKNDFAGIKDGFRFFAPNFRKTQILKTKN